MTGWDDKPPEIRRGYKYLRFLGPGGYSRVFLYLHEATDREVAVKVLQILGTGTADEAIAEAKMMAKFDRQPNIIQVFDAGVTSDGQPYIVMSYCPGPNLWTLAKQGQFRVEQAVRVGVLMAEAVHTAHSFGIVHRDIKPANILTDDAQVPWLTDFGIAGRLADRHDTGFGYSLPWTPPEILDGAGASVATDVYSLGATLWNLLAGFSPFEVDSDNSAKAMSNRIRKKAPRRFDRTDVPPELETLLRQMLAKDPGSRPETAGVVAGMLAQIAKALPQADSGPWHVGAVKELPPRTQPELNLTAVRPHATVKGLEPNLVRPADKTVIPQPLVEPEETPSNWRKWALAAAAVVAVAGVGWGISTLAGKEKPAHAPQVPAVQDAGVLGDDIPPGTPSVSASRVDGSTIRFSWTYSAPLDSDTFSWRTTDGKQTDIANVTHVDLTSPAGTELCLQVKVVRRSGSFASPDWSPAGCGR